MGSVIFQARGISCTRTSQTLTYNQRARRPAYQLGRTPRGIRNSATRSQNNIPCTTVLRHTEEPLSGARQTAVRTDIA
eukprot:scaffold72821_cov117-Phaeocystis_antarctica.AAC.2